MAGQLMAAFPAWLVLWSTYTREFWAFPSFAAQPETVLHETDPSVLAGRIKGRPAGRGGRRRTARVRVAATVPPGGPLLGREDFMTDVILKDEEAERQAALLGALRQELKPHGVTGLLIRHTRLILSGADDSGSAYSGRTRPELRVPGGRPGKPP
jgi:hypothetical protein